MEEHLPLRIDYLGALNVHLRDLRGPTTLAYELIQNADDAKQTSYISFDVRDEALVVKNDGVFTDCEKDTEECAWRNDPKKGYRCDAHRFRLTAGGDKRRERGTTGAFGIGFISVYQITDRPEIRSGKRHWIIQPDRAEQERIQIGENNGSPFNGTRFRLPWAFDPDTMVRKGLEVEPVHPGQIEPFLDELKDSLPKALLFLRSLERIELKRNGVLVQHTERDHQDEKLYLSTADRVSGETAHQRWKILNGDFEEEATALRQEANKYIEQGRDTEVQVAFPAQIDFLEEGRFYVTLPSFHSTKLPLHINADFFPAPNRKRLLFDEDYQGRWNKAALRGVVRIVEANLSVLPEELGHEGLWELLDNAYGQRNDEVFGMYWGAVRSKVSEEAVIWTTTGQWVLPREAFMLVSKKKEKEAIPLLEKLGINVVHLDLNKHQNLLLQEGVGVSSFTLKDLAHALKTAGLTLEREQREVPEWIKDQKEHAVLADEIELLLGRARGQSESNAKLVEEEIRSCAIAWSAEGQLCSPLQLRKAEDAIRSTLTELGIRNRFAAAGNPEPIQRLISPLDVADVIEWLEEVNTENLLEAWLQNPKLILDLIHWFDKQRSNVQNQPELVRRLRQLPIWPSGRMLAPLDSLVVPGTFEDPLGLTSVVHQDVVAKHRSFLTETLQAPTLTVVEYAQEWVPDVFGSEGRIETSTYEKLLRVLARHLGRLREVDKVHDVLSKVAMVRCSDGTYRTATSVYFDTDEVGRVLGDVPTIEEQFVKGDAVKALLEWLGVATRPRPQDIVARIRNCTSKRPSGHAREEVRSIILHLGRRWQDFEDQRAAFKPLRRMAWLPARNDEETWFKPSAIYAPSRHYLFETQAHFIAVGQNQLNPSLREYLGIEAEPRTRQVVDHLLECAQSGVRVNLEVYRVLNERVKDNAIRRLRDKKCLLIRTGSEETYVRPDQVYWAKHPFGRYRFQLNEEMRSYGSLFKQLRVKDEPDTDDALSVIREISERFGTVNKQLEDDDYRVLMTCWEMLADALNESKEKDLFSKRIQELSDEKVIPNEDKSLQRPDRTFFEDRPQLAEKFDALLAQHTIRKPQEAWRAMVEAGVRPLSSIVEANIVEKRNPRRDTGLHDRLERWKPLIKRVLEASPMGDKVSLGLLDEMEIMRVNELKVEHVVQVFNQRRIDPAEDRQVVFDSSEKTLYVMSEEGVPWRALSRELAYVLDPEIEAGQIAPGLNAALSASTEKEAHEVLDEYGYARIEVRGEHKVEDHGPAELGGSDAPDTDSYGEDQSVSGKNGALDDSTDEVDLEGDPRTGGQDQQDRNKQQEEEAEKAGGSTDGKEDSQDSEGNRHSEQRGSTSREDREGADTKGRDANRGENQDAKRKRGDSKQRRRMRSYVTSGNSQSSASPSARKKISEVDAAGINYVMQFERGAGREPKEMDHSNEGYDIESRDERGRIQRYIEVKSLSGLWSGQDVKLSAAQFRYAQGSAEKWWLYVVENALSDEPRVTRVQDPAHQADEFFFDDGWRAIAEESGNANQ